ncbi:MAG: ATP-grasp domain-containing protein [Planctomycetota bacterium]
MIKSLIIGTDEGLIRNVLQSLAGESIQTHVMSTLPMRWSRASRYCNGHIPCKLENLLAPDHLFAETINHYCKNETIDILIPVDILSVACVSKIRSEIAVPIFPIPNVDQILLLNNKWHFKQFLRQLEIPVPKAVLAKTCQEVLDLKLNFPVVVKPTERERGVGVKQLNSESDLELHFSSNECPHEWPLLMEEFVPGEDICTSVLCENGELLYWTIQKRSKHGQIQFVEDMALLKSIRTICQEVAYTGVAHFDARIDKHDGSRKILECNPRFWGSLLASHFAGINFAALGVGLALKGQNPIDIQYLSGLCLSDRVSNISIIKLLAQRRIPFNQRTLAHLFRTLCDPWLTASFAVKRIRKRFGKIFIPGKTRRKQARRNKQLSTSIPPLSSIEAYSDRIE